MEKLLGIVLCMLFFLTACGTQEASSFEQKNEGSAEYGSPGSLNQLISSYNSIKLKDSLDSSLQQNVFKKDGFPKGYELSISEAAKEAVLIIRPVTEKNYPKLESILEKNMRDTLEKEKYSEYTVKINPLWNTTNQTTRQFHEENITNDVVNEMKELYQIDVMTGIHFSETDGRIIRLDLFFMANGTEISDPVQINQYGKEFIRLAEEKGFKAGDVTVNFVRDGKEDWTRKVIPAVNKGLKEMEALPITSLTILNESSPIIINTSLNSTDENAKKVGKQIETFVDEFLQHQPIKESYPGPIAIQVVSADNQNIN